MPGLFEQFPHTNLHELNLDWLIDMVNQFKEELEDSAVLSVNGETGHVTLYESENVILPALPEGVDQWRLVRLVNGQYAGILFYNGNAYIQRGNSTMRLLTQEDIPSSSGVVSWNGLTGVVNVTGADIPVDDTADADSIDQAITTEHTERVNADNALQNAINGITSRSTALLSAYDNRVQNANETDPARVAKRANVCSISGFIEYLVTPANNQTSILIIPDGYIPQKNEYSTIVRQGDGKAFVIQVASTGNVNIFNRGEISTGDKFYIGITYVL